MTMIETLKSAHSMAVERLITACYTAMDDIARTMDCGANVGFHTKALAEVEHVQKVLAVEANPEHFARLKQIANNHPSVELVLLAVVSNDAPHVTFKVSEQYHGRGGVSGLHIWDHIDRDIEFQEISVPAVNFDKLISENMDGRVDFIKFDLEGSEMDLILNSQALFEVRPVIVMENSVHGPKLAGIDKFRWLEFLNGKDYTLVDFDLNNVESADDMNKFNHMWLVPNENSTAFTAQARDVYRRFDDF